MKITYAIKTDRGGRPVNEDSAKAEVSGEQGWFLLADGLGGHGMGDIASQLAVNTGLERMRSGESLPQTFEAVQEAVRKEQKNRKAEKQMKTTLCLLSIDGSKALWGHIGDSRIYRFKNGALIGHTKDHSLLQLLVDAGELKEEEIRFHEDRSKLMRAVGVEWDEPAYEMAAPVKLHGKDLLFRPVRNEFLMVSDGWWELVDEEKMQQTLAASGTPEEWLEKMQEIILAGGITEETDNYTALAVFAE